MEFRIADTFTDSLSKLAGEEQKVVKTTAFDLQLNPVSPGMQLHKLDRAKDKNFWSVRVSTDIRLIVHKTAASLLLCYVDHHDAAYRWAERRRIERHLKTGAAQLVEVRETVREIEIPHYVQMGAPPISTAPKPQLFDGVPDDDLLGYGVPAEWLDDVRRATEDTLFDLAEHLPGEAAEALLELATGGMPPRPVHAAADADPFAHPDAQRRFRVMTNAEDLQRALEYPWEKWTVFLHPSQRDVIERQYSGAARVSGSAGTGKTIVALHRAVHLARVHPQAKVLLATFSDTLARALRLKLERLVGNETGVQGRITVSAIDRVGVQVYEAAFGAARIADSATIRSLLRHASAAGEAHRFSERFLETEWREVVDAWQLATWESYRDVVGLGRKTRLGEQQRALLWSILERARRDLAEQGLITIPGVFARATAHLASGPGGPFDFVVIDEAQDIGVPQLRFLAALAGDREDRLFFAGDLGQRIFQTPFSWRSLGVDVRGRSHTLRINYRTSHQIRRQADRLLPAELADVDGNTEVRRGVISAFNGPEPVVRVLESVEAEAAAIVEWLGARRTEGIAPHEISVFVRSVAEVQRACAAVKAAGLDAVELDGSSDGAAGSVAIGTMHLAKALEFRAVVVAACDDEIIPLQSRLENVADDADLEDVYDTERHLLYVACTRARDHLLVTGVEPASEFLDDLRAAHPDGAKTRGRGRSLALM
jgi:superfamily I DNA/RNA helicase/mRNA-degrading endonuclease RelE of RelBE toxin-antitoxin system